MYCSMGLVLKKKVKVDSVVVDDSLESIEGNRIVLNFRFVERI